MQTERYNGYEVPVLERAPKPAGRYVNWAYDEPGRPVTEIAQAQAVGDHDKIRWLLDSASPSGARAVYSEDGFRTHTDRYGRKQELAPIGSDPFGPDRWFFEGGRGTRRVSGGDIVTYVTCPSISIADGGATAASVSIQAVPNGVSPLFAGSGGATGGTGGFWYPGRTIQYTLMGRGTSSTSPGSTVFQANIATSQNVTTGNALGGTTSVALAASQTNITFEINGWATCRAIGTAGSLMGIGSILLGALATTNVTNMLPLTAPATAAVDTTANSAVNFLVTLGATTVSFTVHMMIWQFMN